MEYEIYYVHCSNYWLVITAILLTLVVLLINIFLNF
jgi:membrane protein YdbS with pleckstrin-like domain